jgi:putative transposase
VHTCIAIAPKHPVASVIGFLKGKSAIANARLSGKERRTILGPRLRGVHGRFDLEQIRQYIREHDAADGPGNSEA